MDQRKELIKLIKHCTSCEECLDEDIADHLLANGGIVPPCKVGDTVYMPWEWNGAKGIACLKVTAMSNVLGFGWSVGTDFDTDDEGYADKYNCGLFKFNDFGKTVFLTEDEAMENQKKNGKMVAHREQDRGRFRQRP